MMNKWLCGLCVLSGLLLAASSKNTVQALSIYEDQYGALMNNVVNVNTPGYRYTEMIVRETASGNLMAEENSNLFGNGQMVQSGDPYHMSIEGPGFFMVQAPQGMMFTRDGRFTLDEEYRLVTFSGGFPVMGQNGEIMFSLGANNSIKFEVTETGLIIMEDSVVDKVLVGEFADSAQLRTFNGTFFEADMGEQAFIPLETPKVRQYYYESSNVDMSKELVAMPDISKKYDANAKVLQILKKINTTGREMGSAQ